MKSFICLIAILFISSSYAYASSDESSGVINIKSNHTVEQTITKLETALKNKGMTIFKRVSHSEGAAGVGLKLRPTEILIFGNPKIGTKLMQCEQLAGLDLPLKALAYQDSEGQVWLAYNNPDYIARRYDIKGCAEVITKMTNALSNFSKAATQ
jgi:uncharacterized protein (DUF302 family)